jgi:hypothetical protein
VTAEDDETYLATYGGRYFFSDLKRHQFSLETRLNVAFNPKLTLEEAETFDFDVFEEGTAVDTGDGIVCVGGRTCLDGDTRYIDWNGDGEPNTSFSDRDFNVQSLRLNAVLRWEYRPGSTIFFVWQQNRSDRIDDGSFDLDRDFGALRSIEPDNMFIVKVNYWLGL